MKKIKIKKYYLLTFTSTMITRSSPPPFSTLLSHGYRKIRRGVDAPRKKKYTTAVIHFGFRSIHVFRSTDNIIFILHYVTPISIGVLPNFREFVFDVRSPRGLRNELRIMFCPTRTRDTSVCWRGALVVKKCQTCSLL